MIYYDTVGRISVSEPDYSELENLVREGQEPIDEANAYESTALHLACQEGLPGAVKLLLEGGFKYPFARQGR